MSQEFPGRVQITPDNSRDDLISARKGIEELYKSSLAPVINLDEYRITKAKQEQLLSPESKVILSMTKNVIDMRREKLNREFVTNVEHRNILHTVIGRLFDVDISAKRQVELTEDHLIEREGEIGAKIFGPLAYNETHRRFFLKDANHLFFYQERAGVRSTLHFEIADCGVIKSTNHTLTDGQETNTPNQIISGDELKNFVISIETYCNRVARNIYGHQSDISRMVVSDDNDKRLAA